MGRAFKTLGDVNRRRRRLRAKRRNLERVIHKQKRDIAQLGLDQLIHLIELLAIHVARAFDDHHIAQFDLDHALQGRIEKLFLLSHARRLPPTDDGAQRLGRALHSPASLGTCAEVATLAAHRTWDMPMGKAQIARTLPIVVIVQPGPHRA